MNPDDEFGIHEWAFPFRQVVVVVPVQGLAQKVLRDVNNRAIPRLYLKLYQTVHMMQPFDIGGKPAAILLAYFDLIVSYP